MNKINKKIIVCLILMLMIITPFQCVYADDGEDSNIWSNLMNNITSAKTSIEQYTEQLQNGLSQIDDLSKKAEGVIEFVSDPGEAINKLLNDNILIEATDIMVQTDSGILAGDPKEIFKILKEEYSSSTFTGTHTKGSYSTWGDVDSGSSTDSIDSFIFATKVNSGDAMILTMKTLMASILTVNNAELQFILGFYTYVIPIALTLCLMYALIDLAGKSQKELQSVEIITAWLLKLAVAFLFVSNSAYFAEGIYNLNNAFMRLFLTSEAAGGGNKVYSASEIISIAMNCDYDSWISSLLGAGEALIQFAIGSILGVFVTLISSVMCYTLKLSLGLRTIFVPLAIADISGHGTTGNGMRFLKKTFGTAMSAGAICFLVSLAASYQITNTVAFSGYIIPFSVIGAISTAKQITEEALGG